MVHWFFPYHRKDWPKSEPSATGWGGVSTLLNIGIDPVDPVMTTEAP